MIDSWKSVVLLAAVAILSTATCCFAAGLEIGDAAPNWKGIVGVDDKDHALADFKKAKVVVIVFTCNHCPVAKAYEDRLIELQKDYKKQKVQVVAVNVNNMEADKLPAMKVRAKEKKFNFPYLYDATQKIGLDYGAIKTPHVFVLDVDRKLAFVGAIDDNVQKPDEVEKTYLRDALDAILADKKPDPAETKAVGCGIKYGKPIEWIYFLK